MPKPFGTIGETKLKILAIIYHNGLHGIDSYGYNVWRNLKKRVRSYIDERDLRNVYRHLKDLDNAGSVKKTGDQPTKGAPKRQLYTLADKGEELKQKFSRYLQMLTEDNQQIAS